MTTTGKRLQDYRATTALKDTRDAQYDEHLVNKILSPLNALASKDLAYGDPQSHSDPLDDLDPRLDTLPYLYTLNAQLQQTVQNSTQGFPSSLLPGGNLLERISVFLREFDPVEARYAGQQWRTVVDVLIDVAEQDKSGRAPMLVDQLLAALFRLDPSAATFTSIHLRILRVCLQQRLYTQACLLLDKDILNLPTRESGAHPEEPYLCSNHRFSSGYITIRSGHSAIIRVSDVLEYYLLGAMAFIALARWSAAKTLLEYVLSAPSQSAPTGLMVEAYKKWVFVSLLADGKRAEMPRTTRAAVVRILKSTAKAYEVVAEAFEGDDRSRLNAELCEGAQIWIEDGNNGLANDVANHRQNLLVVHLEKQFASVPLDYVAAKLEMTHDQTQRYLQQLIDNGSLNALLDKTTDASQALILRFPQTTKAGVATKSEVQLRDELVAQTRRIKDLSDYVHELDRKLSLSKEYLEYTRKMRRNKEQQEQNGTDGQEIEGADPMAFVARSDEDENVMDIG